MPAITIELPYSAFSALQADPQEFSRQMRFEKVVLKDRIQMLRDSGLYLSENVVQLLLSQAEE